MPSTFSHSIKFDEAAQRLALPALGQGRRSRPARKKIRRRKLLEMPQNPQRQVHALLGVFCRRLDGEKKRLMLEQRDYGILLNL
jgi:hypothetical protein